MAVQHEPGQHEMTARSGLRSQRRLQHHDLGRRQLLDAAEEVFGRKGYHETTLREVAERAEFSVGSVYSFFESKDDLFHQIFVRRGQELLAEIEGVVDRPRSPLEQLHDLVDVEVGFFRRHPDFGRLALRYANVTRLASESASPLEDRIGGGYVRATRLQAEVFARGQADGVVRDGDPEALSRLFSGMILSYETLESARGDGEWLALEDLHEIVERAFTRPR